MSQERDRRDKVYANSPLPEEICSARFALTGATATEVDERRLCEQAIACDDAEHLVYPLVLFETVCVSCKEKQGHCSEGPTCSLYSASETDRGRTHSLG